MLLMKSVIPNRRRFLKTVTAAVVGAPAVMPHLRSAPPSSRVRHASIGAGGMARADLLEICKADNIQLVAVAEVDVRRAEGLKADWPELRVYADWREMLDREKELDSVNVSTPDHMHAPATMTALHRGIHVYCQKPLTHGIRETRQLTLEARRRRLVTQMGIQIHSNLEYRLAVQLIQDKAIGPVKEVHTWSNKKWGDHGPMPRRTDPVPAGFEWDLWLGVCAVRPYIGEGWYHPGNWRRRLDFGTGTFGDMGCHIYDPVFKALALTAPLTVRSEGAPPNEHSWSTDAVVEYIFPGTPFTAGPTVRVTWYDGDRRPPQHVVSLAGGALPDQGSVFLGAQGVMVLPHIGMPKLLPEIDFKDFAMPEVEGANHWIEFVEAVRGNGSTSTHFDYSGPLTEAVLLGSVASRFPETTLQWDSERVRFVAEDDANQYLSRPYRKGWEVEGL